MEGVWVVGRPHPSHPFTKPHPTVYENTQAIREKKTKNIVCKMRGLIDHPIVDCSTGCMNG